MKQTTEELDMKVIERLAKLHNMAEGAALIGNQQEAEAFATKVQELLLKHNLTLSDLEFKQEEDGNPIGEETVDAWRLGIRPKRTKMAWQSILASAIATSQFCRVILHPRSNTLTFVGRSHHRKRTIYVYGVLAAAGELLAHREHRKNKRQYGGAGPWSKGFLSSFLLGYAYGVRAKLESESERLRAEATTAGKGTALVRLDQSLAAVTLWQKEHIKTVPVGLGRSSTNSNTAAAEAGYKAGQSVRMPKEAIEEKQARKQLA